MRLMSSVTRDRGTRKNMLVPQITLLPVIMSHPFAWLCPICCAQLMHTLIASMAYSTWNRRPSGLKVFTPLSYSLRVRNMSLLRLLSAAVDCYCKLTRRGDDLEAEFWVDSEQHWRRVEPPDQDHL